MMARKGTPGQRQGHIKACWGTTIPVEALRHGYPSVAGIALARPVRKPEKYTRTSHEHLA